MSDPNMDAAGIHRSMQKEIDRLRTALSAIVDVNAHVDNEHASLDRGLDKCGRIAHDALNPKKEG